MRIIQEKISPCTELYRLKSLLPLISKLSLLLMVVCLPVVSQAKDETLSMDTLLQQVKAGRNFL